MIERFCISLNLYSGTMINVHTSKQEFYRHNRCLCMLSFITQKTFFFIKLWFDLGEAISSSSIKKEGAERSPLESPA